MSGWTKHDSSHTNPDAGGVTLPPQKAMCHCCVRRRLVSDMTIEINERSDSYGYLVCAEDCYEGPYPDLLKPAKNDDIGPIHNIYY